MLARTPAGDHLLFSGLVLLVVRPLTLSRKDHVLACAPALWSLPEPTRRHR
jgi:hypothetical protein